MGGASPPIIYHLPLPLALPLALPLYVPLPLPLDLPLDVPLPLAMPLPLPLPLDGKMGLDPVRPIYIIRKQPGIHRAPSFIYLTPATLLI